MDHRNSSSVSPPFFLPLAQYEEQNLGFNSPGRREAGSPRRFNHRHSISAKTGDHQTSMLGEGQPLLQELTHARAYGASGLATNGETPAVRKVHSMIDFKGGAGGSGLHDLSKMEMDAAEMDGDTKSSPRKRFLVTLKTCLVFVLVVSITALIARNPEKTSEYHEYTVSNQWGPHLNVTGPNYASLLKLKLRGALLYAPVGEYVNVTVTVAVDDGEENVTVSTWVVPVQHTNIELTKEVVRSFLVPINRTSLSADEELDVVITMTTMSSLALPVGIDYDFLTDTYYYEVAYAGVILVFVYVLIIFELVHRALAAILGSLCTLAILSIINVRPSMEEIITWLDFETLSLLFGMMLMVAIFSETGFFDWIALQAYRLARGKPWPLMTILCLVSATLSAFLDNVTTVLLLTPVTIRLCEALRLDPRRFLIAEVIFANIGGTATAVGDPPNVIIVSSKELQAQGINFLNFTLHMSLGIVFIGIGAFGLLRVLYRNMGHDESDTHYELVELYREIEVWRRTAYSISIASKEEATIRALLLEKVAQLEHAIAIRQMEGAKNTDFEQTLSEMRAKYRITNKWLLLKCSIVMVVVILSFFVSSIVDWIHLDLGWISFLGAIWLLVLADFAELEALLDRVEWATLIFFAALFALMEALQTLGLISWIGSQVSSLVLALPDNARLPVALLAVLWSSALASSFIDNIPFTAAMVPVILELGEMMPIYPLVWALAMGACLGGNGTLIGASANVVAAGIAQQHGYGFSFLHFFKVGFVMMLWTTFLASIYLLICHVVFDWNYS